MDEIKKIRSNYRELMGYLVQIPLPKTIYESLDRRTVWERVNQCINELEEITQGNYQRFRIVAEPGEPGYEYANLTDLRTSLGGLINRLHMEYFSEDDEPFGSKPSMVLSQNQQQIQSQETYIQMVVDLTSKVSEKLKQESLKPEERSFLEQLKSGISTAKSGLELLVLALNTGAALGLTVVQIAKLLK